MQSAVGLFQIAAPQQRRGVGILARMLWRTAPLRRVWSALDRACRPAAAAPTVDTASERQQHLAARRGCWPVVLDAFAARSAARSGTRSHAAAAAPPRRTAGPERFAARASRCSGFAPSAATGHRHDRGKASMTAHWRPMATTKRCNDTALSARPQWGSLAPRMNVASEVRPSRSAPWFVSVARAHVMAASRQDARRHELAIRIAA